MHTIQNVLKQIIIGTYLSQFRFHERHDAFKNYNTGSIQSFLKIQ